MVDRRRKVHHLFGERHCGSAAEFQSSPCPSAPPQERHHAQGLSRRRTPAPGRARWPHGDELSGDTSGGREAPGPQTSTGCDPATMRRHHGRSSVHDSPPDSRGSDSGGPWRNAGASPSWPRTSHCHALPTAPPYARCRSLPCPRRSVRCRDSRPLRGSRQSVLQSTAGRNTPMPGRDCSVTLGPRGAHATSAPAPAHTRRARPGRRRRTNRVACVMRVSRLTTM